MLICLVKTIPSELGFDVSCPMRLIGNNQPSLLIASNPNFHECSKHIEVGCHFVHERLLNNFEASYVKCEDQLPNLFTKLLEGKD